MAKIVNLARVTSATTGTGTLTLGDAVAGFNTFANAGVADGDVVAYGIQNNSGREYGYGTYSASGPTLTRTVTSSTNGNAAINLTGTSEVFVTAGTNEIPQNLGELVANSTRFSYRVPSGYTQTEFFEIRNNVDADGFMQLQSGVPNGTDRRMYFSWKGTDGNIKWHFGKNPGHSLIWFDYANNTHRMQIDRPDAGGATHITSGGTGKVYINGFGEDGTGTGGFWVQSGTASPVIWQRTESTGTVFGASNTLAIDGSAILEAQSTTKGFLPPRLTTAQRDAISGPAAGLQIYNTDTQQMEVRRGVGGSAKWVAASVNGEPFADVAFNLLQDSGRFCDSGSYLSHLATSFVSPGYFTLGNSSTFTSHAKFIFNNSTYGGSGSALDSFASSLIAKIRAAGSGGPRCYNTEFFIGKLTKGSGTSGSHTAGGVARYETLYSRQQVRLASVTMHVYVAAKTGTFHIKPSTGGTIYLDGVSQGAGISVVIAPGDGWKSILIVDQLDPTQSYGYTPAVFDVYQQTTGDEVLIAAPCLMPGVTLINPNIGVVPAYSGWTV